MRHQGIHRVLNILFVISPTYLRVKAFAGYYIAATSESSPKNS